MRRKNIMYFLISFNSVEIIGFLAGIALAISSLPQLIKALKTKDLSAVSLLMLVLILTGSLLWLTYGIIVGSLSMIICNSIQSSLYLTMVILKLISLSKRHEERDE